LEVNTRIHWTKQLTRELISKSSEEFGDYGTVADTVRTKYVWELKGKSQDKWPVIHRDGGSFVFCHGCDTEKALHEFYKKIHDGCKSCISIKVAKYGKTWRGVFVGLLSNSRSDTKTRNHRGRNHDHDIDLEHVVGLFVEQKGRCFYSRAPMTTEGPFKISLERLDTTKGYVKGNVVLICMMLNSTDYLGHTGWSRDKFIYMTKEFEKHDVAS
jgi:hypothetical protein